MRIPNLGRFRIKPSPLCYFYRCQIKPSSSRSCTLALSLLAFFLFRLGEEPPFPPNEIRERTTTTQAACGTRRSSIQSPAISPSLTLPQSCAFLDSFGLGSLHCSTLRLLDMKLCPSTPHHSIAATPCGMKNFR